MGAGDSGAEWDPPGDRGLPVPLLSLLGVGLVMMLTAQHSSLEGSVQSNSAGYACPNHPVCSFWYPGGKGWTPEMLASQQYVPCIKGLASAAESVADSY